MCFEMGRADCALSGAALVGAPRSSVGDHTVASQPPTADSRPQPSIVAGTAPAGLCRSACRRFDSHALRASTPALNLVRLPGMRRDAVHGGSPIAGAERPRPAGDKPHSSTKVPTVSPCAGPVSGPDLGLDGALAADPPGLTFRQTGNRSWTSDSPPRGREPTRDEENGIRTPSLQSRRRRG